MAAPLWNDAPADAVTFDSAVYGDKYRKASAERLGYVGSAVVADDNIEKVLKLGQDQAIAFASFFREKPTEADPYDGTPGDYINSFWFTLTTFKTAAWAGSLPTRKYDKAFADDSSTTYLDGAAIADGDRARNQSDMRVYLRSSGAWVYTPTYLPDVVTHEATEALTPSGLSITRWLQADDYIDAPIVWQQIRDAINLEEWWGDDLAGQIYDSSGNPVDVGWRYLFQGGATGTYSIDPDYATACAAAAADFNASAPFDSGITHIGPYVTSLAYDRPDLSPGGFYPIIDYYEVYMRKGKCRIEGARVREYTDDGGTLQNRKVNFWLACTAYTGDGVFNTIFDDNGDGVLEEQWHQFDDTTVQHDFDAISEYVGDLTNPPNPGPAPTYTPPVYAPDNVTIITPADDEPTEQGYRTVDAFMFIEGDVPGGFQFTPTSTI